MKVSVIKIGNSKGIRLSKTILEKYSIEEEVELIMEKDAVVIKPVKNVRDGWGVSFKAMSDNNDDELLIDDVFEDENFDQ
jgi:antitoxin MazE